MTPLSRARRGSPMAGTGSSSRPGCLIECPPIPASVIMCARKTRESSRISRRRRRHHHHSTTKTTSSNNLPSRALNLLKSSLLLNLLLLQLQLLLCLLLLSAGLLEAQPTKTTRNTTTTTTITIAGAGNEARLKRDDVWGQNNLHSNDERPAAAAAGSGAGRQNGGPKVNLSEVGAQLDNYEQAKIKVGQPRQIDLGIVEPSRSFLAVKKELAQRRLAKQLSNLILSNLNLGPPEAKRVPVKSGTPRKIMINNIEDNMAGELQSTVGRLEGALEEPPEAEKLSARRLIRRPALLTTTTTTATTTSRGSTSEIRKAKRASGNLEAAGPRGPILEAATDNYNLPPAAAADVADLMMHARALQDPFPVGAHNSPGTAAAAALDQAGNLQSQATSSGNSNPTADEYVTCPPDYDDPAIIIAETSAGSNLTAEQQQQLYADSSGLLNLNNNNNINNSLVNANESFRGFQPPATQCYQPGFRMIEMITKVITPILFSIIIVVGLVGNIIVMLVILDDRKTERELTPTGLLILDLSLADLSFIIFCIPFTGWDYAVGHWVFGALWCKFNQYLIVVCALSSIYTLVLMSVDRFIAIVYPIECISLRTSKNTLNAIYIKWIVILIMASPTIPRHGLVESALGPDQYNCRFLTDQYDPLYFQIAFFVSSYLFPLILIFVLYLSLLNKLWFGSKPHGHKESIKTLESKKKVTWLVAGIVVVFALCWCPIQVMLILMRLKSHKITATYIAVQVFSHTLGYMNSCVNPIVYAFASESFLNSFKRSSLGRFCYRCLCLHNNHDTSHGHDHNSDRSMITNRHHANSLQHQPNQSLNNASPQHRGSQQHPTGQLLNQQMPLGSKKVTGIDDPNGSMINDTNLSTTTICTTALNNKKPGFNKIVSLPPLEPRDRALLIQAATSGPSNLQNKPLGESQDKPATNSFASPQANVTTNGHGPSLSNGKQAKQQLVARVIQSSNQVSHCCESTYQRELLAP